MEFSFLHVSLVAEFPPPMSFRDPPVSTGVFWSAGSVMVPARRRESSIVRDAREAVVVPRGMPPVLLGGVGVARGWGASGICPVAGLGPAWGGP